MATYLGFQSTFLGMKSTLSDGNLNKSTFLVVGSSLVVPWFVLGSYLSFGSNDFFILGLLHGRDKDGTREGNLKKSAFFQLPLSRSSLFILCIALFPYYGDSSGAILEVPSEALLHLSVVSRSSVGGIRQGIREGKETVILRKSFFLYLQNLILLHVTRVLVRSPPFKAKRNPEHLL